MALFDKVSKLWQFAGAGTSNKIAGPFTGAYFDYSTTLATIAPALLPPGVAAPLTPQRAMQVPAVARAVSLYTATIAGAPLTSSTGASAWLNKTAGVITPGKRNAELFQDLFFYGAAVLLVDRDGAGTITDAVKLPRAMWSVDKEGYICLEDKRVPDQSQFVYIPSLLPIGFLEYAEPTLNHYFDLLQTIQSRGANPIPLVELHVTQDYEGTAEELQAVQDAWAAARSSKNGAVAVTPFGIQLIAHTAQDAGAMLIEARNAVRLDIANYANANASLVDGNSGTSDTYSNTLQDANEFLRLSLGLFTSAITQRLSQDDVTAPGETVSFDFAAFNDFTASKGNAVAGPAPAPALETGTTTA
ncbi:portal protein [Arthrobacter phage Berka]|nr:portal protein [Arthrobacter phage Berka]